MRRKKQINRRNKVHLVFDDEERRLYLTGFQKRNQERKARARERLEKELKEEKKRIKEKQRKLIMKLCQSDRGVPEVDHLVEPVRYELPDHIVTVTDLSSVDICGHSGTLLGENKPDEGKTDDLDDTAVNNAKPELTDIKVLKKKLRKDFKALKNSKHVKIKTQIQKKKDKQAAQKLKKKNRKKK